MADIDVQGAVPARAERRRPRPDQAAPDGASSAEIMAALKAEVAAIARRIPRDKPLIYFDYPVHLNVGDLWINAATEAFFSDMGYEVVDRVSLHNFGRRTASRITPDTVLVFQGGGNFGDLFPEPQRFREQILAAWPDNLAIVLPQTLYYSSVEGLKRAADRLARNKRLHIFARDLTTLEQIERHFPASTSPAPDMAHYLWGRFAHGQARPERDEPLYFIRHDQDDAVWPGELTVAPDRTVDWSKFVTSGEVLAFRLLRKLHVKDCAIGHVLPVWRAWYRYRDHLVHRSARLFASHAHIVTNRLHGLLIGLLVERPVTIGDSGYGKLTAYHDSWLSRMPSLRMVGDRIHLRKMRW